MNDRRLQLAVGSPAEVTSRVEERAEKRSERLRLEFDSPPSPPQAIQEEDFMTHFLSCFLYTSHSPHHLLHHLSQRWTLTAILTATAAIPAEQRRTPTDSPFTCMSREVPREQPTKLRSSSKKRGKGVTEMALFRHTPILLNSSLI